MAVPTQRAAELASCIRSAGDSCQPRRQNAHIAVGKAAVAAAEDAAPADNLPEAVAGSAIALLSGAPADAVVLLPDALPLQLPLLLLLLLLLLPKPLACRRSNDCICASSARRSEEGGWYSRTA